MKDKKIVLVFVMLFIMLFTIKVNAGDWWEIYSKIEKGDNSGELYNLMPTQVNKGDIISVKIIVNNIRGWELLDGHGFITWDKEAFEIAETNGKYFVILDENVRWVSTDLVRDNGINVHYEYNSVPYADKIEVFELKFKVKNDAKEGFYNIYLDMEEGLGIDVNGEYKEAWNEGTTLKYQVGKPHVISNYSKDNIETGSYVIGNYLFTHSEPTEEYSGVLTTDYIMLASKSIKSDSKDDMIIYGKSAKYGWVNAITDQQVTAPDEFKIAFVDMKASYQENGIYSDNNDKTIVRLIQFNDKEALVTIENDKERVHGIASMSNKVATLTVNGKNYVVTITDTGVNVESSDNYITNATLTKRTNYSINDYYDSHYSMYAALSGSRQYLSSEHTGKYTSSNYELYLYRINEYYARICLKEKGTSKCAVDYVMSSNEDGSYTELEPCTYFFTEDGKDYSVNWTNNQLSVECHGTCNNSPFDGTYQKENGLTAEDVVRAWETNSVYYRVTFDKQNGDEPNYLYVESGVKLENYYEAWWYFDDHYKEGHAFKEWRNSSNDQVVTLENTITSPVTIKAYYEVLPTKPTLTLSNGSGNYNPQTGNFEYDFVVESDTSFDGAEIYEQGNSIDPVSFGGRGNSVDVRVFVTPNTSKTYYAKTYKDIGGERYYSEKSDEEISVYPTLYTVQFNSNGGSSVTNQQVQFGGTVTRPTDPTKVGYSFVRWELNGVAYDFSTPVEGNLTLNAVWRRVLDAPTLSTENGSYGWTRLSVITEGYYATPSAAASLDGMEVYEVNGNSYTLVTDSASLTYLAGNVNKTFAVKVYTIVNLEKVYSEYSNAIAVNNVIPAPVISMALDASGDPNYANRLNPIGFNDQQNAFRIDMVGDNSIYYIPNCTGDDCYNVDDFDWFEKNGNNLTLAYEGGMGGEAAFYVAEGSRKTYVAKAYVTTDNGAKVYSDESNEITIDLTTPTFTFEVTESQVDNTKYVIRAYVNNYEIHFNQVVINGSDYPDEGGEIVYTVNKLDFDSEGDVEELTLELTDNRSVIATKRNSN